MKDSYSDKVVSVLLSGGIDSACCVRWFKDRGFTVNGIFINYGQLALKQERHAVDRLQSALDIKVLCLTATSSNGFGPAELVGRNAFLISSAIFLGHIHRGLLAIGIHSGTPYYDCSAGFVERMKGLAEEQTDGHLTISAPFLTWDKARVYQYFKETRLPFKLTYSCELGSLPPCGLCASCMDRRLLQC